MLAREEWIRWAEIGARAISPYNTQPWRFAWVRGELHVFVLRTKNFFLKLEGVHEMGLGFVLENLDEGARHLGIVYELSANPTANGLGAPAATLRVTGRTVPQGGLDHVLARGTNRQHYADEPVSFDAKARLAERVAPVAGRVRLHWVERSMKRVVARLLAELESVRFGNHWLLREALAYIELETDPAKLRRDRLDPRTLEHSPEALRFYRRWTRPRWLHRLLVWLGVSRGPTRRYLQMLEASGALVGFEVSERTPDVYLSLGRTVQRFLNEVELLNLSAMPLLSGLYVRDALRQNEEIFTRRQAVRVLRAAHALDDQLNLRNNRLAFMVRVGLGPPKSHRQGRRPIAELITDDL
jgi:hypothetical protein